MEINLSNVFPSSNVLRHDMCFCLSNQYLYLGSKMLILLDSKEIISSIQAEGIREFFLGGEVFNLSRSKRRVSKGNSIFTDIQDLHNI
jgi:hypothetical protein